MMEAFGNVERRTPRPSRRSEARRNLDKTPDEGVRGSKT